MMVKDLEFILEESDQAPIYGPYNCYALSKISIRFQLDQAGLGVFVGLL